MKQIITDFFSFIRKPKDFQYSRNDKYYKWKVFFTLFAFNVVFTILYTVLNFLIKKIFPLEHKLGDLDLSPIVLILVVSFLIPFFEEVVFRLALRRKGILKKIFTQETWSKYFSTFTYISVIIFALLHGNNYKFESYILILLVPFLTISQFVAGFILTYLRVRFNFWMGYLFHAIWNFIVISIYTFSTFNGYETHVNNQDYQLEIKEKSFLNTVTKKMIHTANSDTIYQFESKGFKLKNILNMIDSTQIKYEPTVEYIDIKFTSEKGIPTDSLLNILETEGYIEKKAKTN